MTPQRFDVPLAGSDQLAPATEVWGSEAWRWAALRWIDAQLEQRGMARVPKTPPQPRLRPWSTLLVIDTERHGRFWFKAAIPEVANEAGVLAALRSVAPDTVEIPLIADAERRWMLTPDLGRSMKDSGHDTDLSMISALLRRYSRLQRGSTAVLKELTDAGVPKLGPSDIARELLGMPIDPHVTHFVRGAASRLEELGLPTVIDHGDLNAGNIFVTNPAPAAFTAVVGDWHDAGLGHPLVSLFAPVSNVRGELQRRSEAEADAASERLIRAYISTWSDLVSTATLRHRLQDAQVVAHARQLVMWKRALVRASDAERAQWGRYGTRDMDALVRAAQQAR